MTADHAERVDAATAEMTASIDSHTIGKSIARARALSVTAPSRHELLEIEELLREHIASLLLAVQATADKRWGVGIERSRRMRRLKGIRTQSERGLGPGRLSAHVQINQLARDCQWLLSLHTGDAP
ncbi:DUF6415 family natural product biosynthesis protein [Streptomyces sp. NPDC048644]|uniref:DUF6415 family natural product biosynthesis protein n=1 Tax=Streptomyces sp. NPDC048644 TaxID=3365582 RepID=UPI0037161D0C